jgi:hypothetical protein
MFVVSSTAFQREKEQQASAHVRRGAKLAHPRLRGLLDALRAFDVESCGPYVW